MSKSTKQLFDAWAKSYSGRKILEEHNIDEYGIWEIRGEDPNCDMGGQHYKPFIALFEGTLEDAINYGTKSPMWYTWGAGGSVVLQEIINRGEKKKMLEDIKVTMKLDKEQLVDIIDYWLKSEHEYSLTDEEKEDIEFNVKKVSAGVGTQIVDSTVFSGVSMGLNLNLNQFRGK